MKQVVGAAIVRGGKVLATRRTTPSELAGRWELPGGKVEPGEPLADALEREIAEELRCGIEVMAWLAGATRIGDTHELRVATARLASGEPDPVEHDRVRWLGPDELGDVDWLEPDRPFLLELAEVLRRTTTSSLRAIVFDEDAAAAVVARLRGEGYDAWVVRERLAGEDDDEDHPWAILSDAPELLLELLVDEHDGWLDREEQTGASGGWQAPSPLELPTQPRRIKREGTDD